MPQGEMPIFTRTFDSIAGLLPMTNHFPRAHRHTLTRRLLDAAFDLRERLEEANLRRDRGRHDRLRLADDAERTMATPVDASHRQEPTKRGVSIRRVRGATRRLRQRRRRRSSLRPRFPNRIGTLHLLAP